MIIKIDSSIAQVFPTYLSRGIIRESNRKCHAMTPVIKFGFVSCNNYYNRARLRLERLLHLFALGEINGVITYTQLDERI